MITVKVQVDENEQVCGFRVMGHAEYEEEGKDYDIVCASVSAITLTAALGLQQVLEKTGQFDSKHGHLLVSFKGEADSQTEAVVQTMVRGLQEIAKHYPNRIVIKTVKG